MYMHMWSTYICVCALDYFDCSSLHWAFKVDQKFQAMRMVYLSTTHTAPKWKKKYNHNKNSISKFEVNFQKNFMNEQPNKKQNCARFLCCSCARSLDDLLCPYETCFNSCVRCYLNLFLLYIYICTFFFSSFMCEYLLNSKSAFENVRRSFIFLLKKPSRI